MPYGCARGEGACELTPTEHFLPPSEGSAPFFGEKHLHLVEALLQIARLDRTELQLRSGPKPCATMERSLSTCYIRDEVLLYARTELTLSSFAQRIGAFRARLP